MSTGGEISVISMQIMNRRSIPGGNHSSRTTIINMIPFMGHFSTFIALGILDGETLWRMPLDTQSTLMSITPEAISQLSMGECFGTRITTSQPLHARIDPTAGPIAVQAHTEADPATSTTTRPEFFIITTLPEIPAPLQRSWNWPIGSYRWTMVRVRCWESSIPDPLGMPVRQS